MSSTLERIADEADAHVGAPAFFEDLATAYEATFRSAETEIGSTVAAPLQWEHWLYEMHAANDGGDLRAGLLLPALTYVGRAPYPPPVDSYPAEADAHFAARLERSPFASARARMADFLWIRGGNFHEHATRAADEYVAAAREFLRVPGEVFRAGSVLARAAVLCGATKRDATDLGDLLREFAHLAAADGAPGYVQPVVDASRSFLAANPDVARDMADLFVAEADRMGALGGGQTRDMERLFLVPAAGLAALSMDHSRRDALRLRVPASLEADAAERASDSAVAEMHYLQQALKAYNDLGDTTSAARIKPKLYTASQRV